MPQLVFRKPRNLHQLSGQSFSLSKRGFYVRNLVVPFGLRYRLAGGGANYTTMSSLPVSSETSKSGEGSLTIVTFSPCCYLAVLYVFGKSAFSLVLAAAGWTTQIGEEVSILLS